MKNEVYTAIAMALYENDSSMMHDVESGIITIIPRRSLWSTSQALFR